MANIGAANAARGLLILSDVLTAHGVDAEIRERWLAHVESLRDEITSDAGSNCR